VDPKTGIFSRLISLDDWIGSQDDLVMDFLVEFASPLQFDSSSALIAAPAPPFDSCVSAMPAFIRLQSV
jgi:hypothetical protein